MTQNLVREANKTTVHEAKFWDRIAKKYSTQPIPDPEVYARKLSMSQELFRPDMKLLELGCGTGGTAIAHAPHVAEITAVDVSSAMLEIARQNALAAGTQNIDFVASSVDDYDAPNGSFDVVLCLSLLHLLDDYEAAIAKAWRLLKPGGLLITNTACLGNNMAWFGLVAPLGARLGLIPHVNIFSREDLRRTTLSQGFAPLEEFQQNDGRTYFLIARKLA